MTMKKTLTIECCNECPHLFKGMKGDKCEKTGEQISFVTEVHEDCPLEGGK